MVIPPVARNEAPSTGPSFQFTRAEVLGRAGGTCAARTSGEASGVQRERAASRTGTRFRVGHRELLCRLRPIRVEWTWVTACHYARHSMRENGVIKRGPRANGSKHRVVSTHVCDNARVNDGGQSKGCAGENCGSYCGAHRLPAGRTAAREESRRASCRSGRKNVRRSTTATVQGIYAFRGNRRILVTAREPSQRFFEYFSFESVICRRCESFSSHLRIASAQ